MTLTATCCECGQVLTLPEVDGDCPPDKARSLASMIVCNECANRKRAARIRRLYAHRAGKQSKQSGNQSVKPANVINVRRWIREYQPKPKVETPF